MMTAKELAFLAIKTLNRQNDLARAKQYGRGAGILEDCKSLERMLRRAAQEVLADEGPGLFDEKIKEGP